MSLSSERAAIEGRFKTQLAASAYSSWAVGYDAHDFKAQVNSFRLTIQSGGAENESMGAPGSNMVRHAGAIMIQIFTNGGTGSETARGAAEAVMGFFRNQLFGGVRCRAPYVSGTSDAEGFYTMTVAVPFERDEFNG